MSEPSLSEVLVWGKNWSFKGYEMEPWNNAGGAPQKVIGSCYLCVTAVPVDL